MKKYIHTLALLIATTLIISCESDPILEDFEIANTTALENVEEVDNDINNRTQEETSADVDDEDIPEGRKVDDEDIPEGRKVDDEDIPDNNDIVDDEDIPDGNIVDDEDIPEGREVDDEDIPDDGN